RPQAVNLVDEGHFARTEVRQNRGEVARLFQDRAGGAADWHLQLVGDDVRQRGFAEAGRAIEQHVIERLVALARRGDRDVEVLADAILPDVIVERARAQAYLVLAFLFGARGVDETRVRVHGCDWLVHANATTGARPGAAWIRTNDRRRPSGRFQPPSQPRAAGIPNSPAPTPHRLGDSRACPQLSYRPQASRRLRTADRAAPA